MAASADFIQNTSLAVSWLVLRSSIGSTEWKLSCFCIGLVETSITPGCSTPIISLSGLSPIPPDFMLSELRKANSLESKFQENLSAIQLYCIYSSSQDFGPLKEVNSALRDEKFTLDLSSWALKAMFSSSIVLRVILDVSAR